MPKSLSMLLEIDASDLTDRDAFDPILDLDTRLFIDPHLLKHTEVPELKSSYGKLQQHFMAIGKLLAASGGRKTGTFFISEGGRAGQEPSLLG